MFLKEFDTKISEKQDAISKAKKAKNAEAAANRRGGRTAPNADSSQAEMKALREKLEQSEKEIAAKADELALEQQRSSEKERAAELEAKALVLQAEKAERERVEKKAQDDAAAKVKEKESEVANLREQVAKFEVRGGTASRFELLNATPK